MTTETPIHEGPLRLGERMNKAQKVTLKLLLLVELAMLLYPPYERGPAYRAFALGHHWLFSMPNARIDFATLAAQCVIAGIVGSIICLLARGVSDDKFDAGKMREAGRRALGAGFGVVVLAGCAALGFHHHWIGIAIMILVGLGIGAALVGNQGPGRTKE
jgi:hypothetical protein